MSYSFPTFPLVNKIRITNPAASLDARYGPWPSALSALSAFNSGLREKGLTVGVDNGSGVVEYWFRDGVTDNDFIVKQVPLSATNISGGRAFTTTNDTNITLTLSGTSSSALLNAVVLSAGWTGQLGYDRGGTNASTAQGAINNLAGATTSGYYLRGNGSNVVMSPISASDVPTLNQNTTGSAATLATTRTLWGQDFNGSQNVSGSLFTVGNIIGSGAVTLSAGTGNNNINLTPSGTGLVTVNGSLSASGNIIATNLLSAANTFTRVLSVGNVQIRTVSASNVFIGNSTTGRDATTGDHNFVFGLSAGNALTTGSNNVFVGDWAGRINSAGKSNNFLGYNAGCNNTIGSYNNFLGRFAGRSNTTGGNNNFLGYNAGRSNTIGNFNNFLGSGAGISNTTGSNNNFFGCNAGFCNTTGGFNSFFGSGAGSQPGIGTFAVGSRNSFFGYNAGSGSSNFVTVSASNNSFFGVGAGRAITDGCNNNIFGYNAGCANTTGNCNNFIGDFVGRNNTTGNANNFFGNQAGCCNTTGNSNLFLGNCAGGFNRVGSDNIFIGNNANTTSLNVSALSGVIVLGTGAIATESHQIVLSTANVVFKNTGSTFEIGTPSLTDNLTVYGAVSSTGVVGTNTGFRVNNGATLGNVLRGDGTNFVSSTLAAADIGSGQALTTTNDSNVTLSLSGSSSSALLKNVLLSAGWVGQLAVGRGGTGSNNGSIAGTSTLTFAASGTNNITLSTVTGNVVIDRADINGGTIDGVSIGSSSVATYLKVDSVAIDNNDITFSSFPGGTLNHPSGGYVAINGNSAGTQGNLTGPVGADLVIGTNLNDATRARITLDEATNGNITFATNGIGNVVIPRADINGGAIDGVSIGSSSVATSISSALLDVDNIRIDGNTVSSTNTNGNITLAPNGTGDVLLDADTVRVGDSGATATVTTNGAGNLTLNTNSGTNSGVITINQGTNGNIELTPNGSGSVIIPKADINGGTIDGTTIGLTVAASGVFTGVTVTGDVNINGNLFVTGSATQIDTTHLIVSDPIIFLGEGNLTDNVDIGFTAAYNHGLTPPRHTGLIRNNIGGEWTLFSNLSSEILSAVQIPLDNPSIVIDTLNANIRGNVTGTLTGNVSGTALRANQFTTGRIISATGDISYSSGTFDGSANVTGTATINNNAVTTAKILDDNVTYAKIQNVTATDRLLGRSSAGAGDIEEIVCTTSGRALLSAANVATQRNNLGLGSTQSVTFGDVIVDNQTQTVLNKVYTGSANLSDTLNLLTVPDASYKTVKYTVQIKRVSDSRRCALEILATKDNATWTGTVYGIVDPAGLFADVDVSVNGGSVELAFVFGADNITYNVTAFAQAISD